MELKRTIRNCRDSFKFVCPKTWEQLQPTEESSVRFCGSCRKNVYFCATDEETIRAAKEGRCIAREIPGSCKNTPGDILVGEVGPSPDDPTEEERAELDRYAREQNIDTALEEMGGASRSCPECRYPVQDGRIFCIVCHFKV